MLTRITRPRTGQEGFTLIELLVVVAIIALLATFAVPKLFEAINKAKAAPGQADMNTISSALERHYFDMNAYPSGTDTAVKTALTGGYVKAATTFANGYKKGYAYFSNGTFYILVDVGNNPSGSITMTCGGAGGWSDTATIGAGLAVGGATDAPTPTELASCVVTSTASDPDFVPANVKLVTN